MSLIGARYRIERACEPRLPNPERDAAAMWWLFKLSLFAMAGFLANFLFQWFAWGRWGWWYP